MRSFSSRQDPSGEPVEHKQDDPAAEDGADHLPLSLHDEPSGLEKLTFPIRSDLSQIAKDHASDKADKRSDANAEETRSAASTQVARGTLQAVVGAICFTSTTIFTQAAKIVSGDTLNGGLYGALRSLLACVVLAPFAWKSFKHIRGTELRSCFWCGLSTALWMASAIGGQPMSALAIGSTYPLMLAASGWKRQKPKGMDLAALGFSAVGLTAIFRASPTLLFPNVMALGAAAAYATYLSRVDRSPKEAAAGMAFVSNAFTVGMGAMLYPFLPGGFGSHFLGSFLCSLGNGIGVAAGFYCATAAAQKINKARAGLLGLLEIPLAPAALTAFRLGIPASPYMIGNGFIFIAGLLGLGASVKEIRDKKK